MIVANHPEVARVLTREALKGVTQNLGAESSTESGSKSKNKSAIGTTDSDSDSKTSISRTDSVSSSALLSVRLKNALASDPRLLATEQ